MSFQDVNFRFDMKIMKEWIFPAKHYLMLVNHQIEFYPPVFIFDNTYYWEFISANLLIVLLLRR